MLNLMINGLIFFVVLLIGVGAAYVWHNTSKATIVADNFFLLLRQGQFEEARALTTPDFQQFTSLQDLCENAKVSGLIHAIPSAWINREIAKDIATLAGGIPQKDNSTYAVALQLLRSGETWLVNGVEVSPLIVRNIRRFSSIRINPGFKVIVAPTSPDN